MLRHDIEIAYGEQRCLVYRRDGTVIIRGEVGQATKISLDFLARCWYSIFPPLNDSSALVERGGGQRDAKET